MIANIFIKAVKNFKKISKHGIAKMCRNIFHVEQNLSAIRTKSDPHLMKAHRFYELLYKKVSIGYVNVFFRFLIKIS